ncbi:MAG: V-type ATPase 116kDa subunit family protein [Desulfobulbaceae bacterium]
MVKIMVLGPQDLLLEALALLQELGIMQIDEEVLDEGAGGEVALVPQLPDSAAVLQHQYYEKLSRKIDELLAILPGTDGSEPEAALRVPVDTLAELIPGHLAAARNRREEIDSLTARVEELARYRTFLSVLDRIFAGRAPAEDVEYAGFDLPADRELAEMQACLDAAAGGRVVVEVVPTAEGKGIGVVLAPSELAGKVRTVLEECRLHWFQAPAGLEQATVPERAAAVDSRLAETRGRLAALLAEEQSFAGQWQAEYLKARQWLTRRLSLLQVTAAVVRTRMCFFIHGWLPAGDLQRLRAELEGKFNGRVVVEEMELAERDFARIPTALHNPAYFEPFELFTRLLPMPAYGSFDLTPFIGIFFPIFFGMMLGDVGYGLILMVVALVLVRRFSGRKNIRDAGKILFISALYAVLFGWLYGECLGTVGHRFLGMEPVCFDRQTSIIPMLYFAVAAGVVHVLLGLVLGVISSLRLKMRKEAVFRLLNILFILSLCGLALSWFTPSMRLLREPLLLTLVIFIPVLLFTGGVMAPLELLKNVGNIVSYARIMAVGLTSVLLAYVANYMAGRMGSVWVGILVALILHLFNLLLGVFAPTIHSLRLHYVEFLTKFMEPGGKKFTPLGKR